MTEIMKILVIALIIVGSLYLWQRFKSQKYAKVEFEVPESVETFEEVKVEEPKAPEEPKKEEPKKDASWGDFFAENNSVIGKSQKKGDFIPASESDQTAGDANTKAPIKIEDSRKQTDGSFDPDLYNVQNLLPQEKHDDWFEVVEDPISVKNRHLISVQQSVGINTVGSSKKNSTLDLRNAPPNPKIVVSPWLQSTIEPDYNTKSLC